MTTLNTTLDKFITDNYDKIVHIARKIIKKSDPNLYEELAHHALESFIKHERAEELIEKKQALQFLSGIMHRNYYSGTSPWHKLYRYAGKEVPLNVSTGYLNGQQGSDWIERDDMGTYWIEAKENMYNIWDHAYDLPYDEDPNGLERDLKIESIQGIMEDMEADTVEQWFRVTLFKMWLDQPNYSELSRITGIPRTSISQAVSECKDYIKQTIEIWN